MPDEVEQKPETARTSRLSEVTRREGQFTDETKQTTWNEATEKNRMSKHHSATHECLSDTQIADLKQRGLAEKFEIIGLTDDTGAKETGTVTEYTPQEIIKNKSFALGLEYEDKQDNRSAYQKLMDFTQAAGKHATNQDEWTSYIQGELDKMIGVGEGLNIAKEQTKGAVVAGWNALTDGTVAHFLAKPNAINDPLFHAVGGALTAMAEDPNAANHALERVGNIIISGSERYSALPNREKGHVIGETMFAMVNPEGSTEGGELALKIADRVATHVDATVMKAIQQSMKAAEEAAKTSPEIAQEMKQMLQNYLREKGLTGPELEYAGVPKGYFDELKLSARGDNYFAMSSEGESSAAGSAFRRDHDPYCELHPKGWRKSHINADGDLVPANPEGKYKGQEMTVCHHLDGGWNAKCKGSSPFTSFSAEDGSVISRYGDYLIKLDLNGLKDAKNAGLVKADILELPDILKAIDEAPGFSEIAKNKHRKWAIRDNEILIKGVIPGRFITVEKL